jgi:hypothetical protein
VSNNDGLRGEKGNQGNQGFRGIKGEPGARGERGEAPPKRKINYVQTGVYVMLALVVALAFYLNHENYEDDERERCKSGVDSRNVQRSVIEAIYGLAAGVAERDETDPPLTPEEREQYNKYIARLNKFRADSYNNIKPSSICAPYVDDDNVDPPTPPLEPIPKKE